MNRQRVAFLVLVVITSVAVRAVAQENHVLRESKTGSDCACPKEGRWKAQNLEGWMDCTGPVNFKKKLGEVKDKGTIWILDDDCLEVFAEASRKKDEDSVMKRVEGCGYEGTINGEEDGLNMVIELAWELEGDEFIKGDMHSNPSLQGMFCEYYRPYEISFDEPIPEDEYEEAKNKMEKKLAAFRRKEAAASD